MTDANKGFVKRWSRRKRAARGRASGPSRPEEPAREAPQPGHPPPAPEGESSAAAPAESVEEAEIVKQLPDIDSLDDSSDFTVFLQEGVPEALRRKALRKLWRVNPVLANLDGLNDYDEDFTAAATVVKGLKSIYKVGKAMVREEAEGEAEPPEAIAEQPDPGADHGQSAEAPAAAASGADPAAVAPADPAAAEPADPDRAEARKVPPPAPNAPTGGDSNASRGARKSRRAAGRSARERRWGRFSGSKPAE